MAILKMKKLIVTTLFVVVGLATGLFLSQFMVDLLPGNPEPLAINNNSIIVSSR
jgi:hypothetical protein